jgi:hypothetical protein
LKGTGRNFIKNIEKKPSKIWVLAPNISEMARASTNLLKKGIFSEEFNGRNTLFSTLGPLV